MRSPLYGVRGAVYPGQVRGSNRSAALRFGALAGLILASAAFSTASNALAQSPTPRATETPPPPTATPSPADLGLAGDLAFDGEYDAAIGAYRAVIERDDERDKPAARLGLAKALLADAQTADAARQLDIYLFEAPFGADVRDAQFLLAEALRRLGDWSSALPLYDAYIGTGGAAAVYARLGRAEVLARVGRTPAAEAEASALLGEELPVAARSAFVLTMAEAFDAVKATPEALEWYARLGEVSGSPADQALALWRSAVIKLQASQDGWEQDVLTLILRYPATASALQAVGAFFDMEEQAGAFAFALVYYQNGRDGEARPRFEQVIADKPDAPNAARASYFLAVLDERQGDIDRAIVGYARVLDIDPSVEVADDALWWQGRLLEQQGDVEQAGSDYGRLADEYATSARAGEARFRLGLLDYDAGAFDAAAGAFERIARDASGIERERALLWRGKALAADGDEGGVRDVWVRLHDEAPSDYYGLRAAALLGESTGSLDDGDVEDVGPTDWAEVERWLRDSQGSDATPTPIPVLGSEHWRLGQELLSLGLRRSADAEFSMALEGATGDPSTLFELARALDTLGLTHLSSRAAALLLNSVDEGDAENAPEGLWRVAYPAPYEELLTKASEDEGAPELLMLALIRQESFFDPLAGSPAGALGLTQVIPSTGEAIAAELGVSEFEVEDLFTPSVSIAFGAYYLSSQLELFDGNVYHALAAYNGGPGNALRWGEAAGDDVDRFVEEIEFSETRLYIRLVLENLARYRQLYAGLEAPTLPGD